MQPSRAGGPAVTSSGSFSSSSTGMAAPSRKKASWRQNPAGVLASPPMSSGEMGETKNTTTLRAMSVQLTTAGLRVGLSSWMGMRPSMGPLQQAAQPQQVDDAGVHLDLAGGERGQERDPPLDQVDQVVGADPQGDVGAPVGRGLAGLGDMPVLDHRVPVGPQVGDVAAQDLA